MGRKKSGKKTEPSPPVGADAELDDATLREFNSMYERMPSMEGSALAATMASAPPAFYRFYAARKEEQVRREAAGATQRSNDQGATTTGAAPKGGKGTQQRDGQGAASKGPATKDAATKDAATKGGKGTAKGKGVSVATMCVALQALSIGRIAQQALSFTFRIASIPDAAKFHNYVKGFVKGVTSTGYVMALAFYNLLRSVVTNIGFTIEEFTHSIVDCIRKGDRRSPETTGKPIILNVTFKPFAESAYVVTSGTQDMFVQNQVDASRLQLEEARVTISQAERELLEAANMRIPMTWGISKGLEQLDRDAMKRNDPWSPDAPGFTEAPPPVATEAGLL